MYVEGVSYYVIDADYAGPNKTLYSELFNTLYVNDTIIRYDWHSGLAYAEDSVTHDRTDPVKLSNDVAVLLESDAAVHKWMYRKGDTVDEY